MRNLALLSLFGAALLSGCTLRSTSSGSGAGTSATYGSQPTVQSSRYDVSQMRASMSAQSGDTTVKLYAALFVDTSSGNTPVILDQGDYFTARIGSEDPIVLVREPAEDPNDVHYTATLPAASAAEDIFVSFARPAGKDGAPNTVIHVPEPFTIQSTPPVSVKKGSAFDVQISHDLGSLAELEVSGNCLDPDKNPASWLTFDYNDSVSIDTSGLVFESGQTTGCDVSFYLSAISEGSLDPNFLGGVSGLLDVEGIQKRGLDTAVIP